MDLTKLQEQLKNQSTSAAPVHLWDPPFCGNMDIRIKQDGTWLYMGTPITRQPMINLFSTVLKKENDDYFLVTPVEKVGIQVEDTPFIVTEWEQLHDYFIFKTPQGNQFTVSSDNPVELRFNTHSGSEIPYVLVRDNLYAKLHQNVFYQLIEMGHEVDSGKGTTELVLNSGDYQFSMGQFPHL